MVGLPCAYFNSHFARFGTATSLIDNSRSDEIFPLVIPNQPPHDTHVPGGASIAIQF